jgi:hypothetical protein
VDGQVIVDDSATPIASQEASAVEREHASDR